MVELAKQFVTTTDEVWRLQNEPDPECKLFQQMARHGHDNGEHRTKQGTYVCTPNGTFLASGNSNSPDQIMAIMQKGLQAWKNTAEVDRQLPTSTFKPKHRWEDSYPENGLVLWMCARDLPSTNPDVPSAAQWNQDAIWYSAEEARQWLPTRLDDDDPHPLPRRLAQRLARFHFVDTVKGQTSPFSRGDVGGTSITTRIVKRQGNIVRIAIEGKTRARSSWDWNRRAPHGIETRLMGSASFDTSAGEFIEFELVAIGERWGQTRFNARQRDPETSAIGFVAQLASADEPKIAPGFIESYEAKWVQRP